MFKLPLSCLHQSLIPINSLCEVFLVAHFQSSFHHHFIQITPLPILDTGPSLYSKAKQTVNGESAPLRDITVPINSKDAIFPPKVHFNLYLTRLIVEYIRNTQMQQTKIHLKSQ